MKTPQYFAHPKALIDSDEIGAGTRIWAFAHVMKGAKVGSDCNIGEQCFIESGVSVGDRSVIKNGVSLWHGVTLSDDVFIGPNAVFTNDLLPRAKIFRETVETRVCQGASIGANATIRCGITIGRWSIVGAGAVVTRDVPDFALVIGNPARVRNYVCRCGQKLEFNDSGTAVCPCGYRLSNSSGVISEIG